MQLKLFLVTIAKLHEVERKLEFLIIYLLTWEEKLTTSMTNNMRNIILIIFDSKVLRASFFTINWGHLIEGPFI